MSEFLPCPFCGKEPVVGCDDYSLISSQDYFVECITVDCIMPAVYELDYEVLKRLWNKRNGK